MKITIEKVDIATLNHILYEYEKGKPEKADVVNRLRRIFGLAWGAVAPFSLALIPTEHYEEYRTRDPEKG